MIPKEVRNIIFDFGGVFFEIDYHAPVRAFAQLGYGDFASIYTQANQEQIFDLLETGKVSDEEFWKFLESKVPGVSRASIMEAWNCILIGLWPERVEFVHQLRQQGYRTFLLSNTNAIHVAAFEPMIDKSMGLERFRDAFEKVYYSNVIGIKKPYPQTYLEVCAWNNLDPAVTLFIDDSIQHVEGARKAGLHAIHLAPGMRVEELFTP